MRTEISQAMPGQQRFNTEVVPYFWDSSTTELFEFRDRLVKQRTFRRAFQKSFDLSSKIFFEMRRKVKGKIDDHVVIEVVGTQGIGKSRAVQALVRLVWGKLDSRNFVFTYEAALNRAKDLPKRSYIVVDEQPLMFGAGKEREAQEIINLIETCRIDGVSVIFVSPVSREQVAVHYCFEVIQRRVKENLTKVAIKSRDRRRYLGHFLVTLQNEKKDKFYIYHYLPKKRNFVEQIKQRSLKRLDIDDRAKKVMKDPLCQHAQTKQQWITISMKHFPSLTIGEHEAIVSYITMQRRMRGLEKGKAPKVPKGKKPAAVRQRKDMVKEYYKANPKSSLHEAAKHFGVSHTTIAKYLKDLAI